MSCMIKAVLSNPRRPDSGQITIPFPIPDDRYDQVIKMLRVMDLGHAADRDCTVDAVDSRFHVLHALEGTPVNVDQLDYLAKRLDSFCVSEDSQFQAMAYRLKLTDIKDFINLTFCCQQATVITNFSDLKATGRSHFLNLNAGSARIEELENLDGEETALLLIDSESGVVTPYGVVYDNGMVLAEHYNGRQFPAYYYDSRPLVLEIRPRQGLVEGENPEYLYLPASEQQIKRTLRRVHVDALSDACLCVDSVELPEDAAAILDLEHLKGDDLPGLNRLCRAVLSLDGADLCREHGAAQEMPLRKIALTLATADRWYYLTLPASWDELEQAKQDLDVEAFAQAGISAVKFSAPHLDSLIPLDTVTVEDANALALCLREMEQEDGELLKFCAALEAEHPSAFAEAVAIAMELDDYELVPEDMDAYGRQVLRRIGTDDEILDTIDGYMDFARLGRDAMEEDGIRRTSFGLVCRLSAPFPPEPEIGQTMM